MKQDLAIFDRRSPFLKEILDRIPTAVAIWTDDESRGLLNYQAMQLLGVAKSEFRHATWVSRVDPRDRKRFYAAWERLKDYSETVCSDYRFLAKDGQNIWLRDVSAAYPNEKEETEAIVSTYTDISNLKSRSYAEVKPWSQEAIDGVISPVIHEIRNNLHAIRLEIDLLLLDFAGSINSDRLVHSIDRVNRSLQDLREYLLSPEPQLAATNPKLILDDVLHRMKHELEGQGIRVRLSQSIALPLVWIDSKQFRSALERVIDFCGVLLQQGGELQIATRIKKIDNVGHVELTLTTSSLSSLGVDEADVFRPFLRVNNRQIGLGMALASQILRGNQGNISFVKETPRRGQISILLKPWVQ
jgi:PAS domain S-box-containing protein